MECRRTPHQTATAAWACAQVGRRCAALIKVYVRRAVTLLIELSRFAATIQKTTITADAVAIYAPTGIVCLASVSTPVRFFDEWYAYPWSTFEGRMPSARQITSIYKFPARALAWGAYIVEITQATSVKTDTRQRQHANSSSHTDTPNYRVIGVDSKFARASEHLL